MEGQRLPNCCLLSNWIVVAEKLQLSAWAAISWCNYLIFLYSVIWEKWTVVFESFSHFSLFLWDALNRRTTAFKPSLFSRVCLWFFCTTLPTIKLDWNVNDQLTFCLCLLKNEMWRINFLSAPLNAPRVQSSLASLKKILNHPIQKSLIVLGRWGMDEEWNVPKWWFQRNEIPIILKLKMCY